MEESVGGLNINQFLELYNEALNHTTPFGMAYAPPTYDAVWALALGLNKTVTKMADMGKNTLFN